MKTLRSRFTYANVMATVALFVALGGASYAAVNLPKNSVGTKQLKRGAVTGAKVKAGSIPATALKPAAVGYNKAESNARFLGSTVVVNKTIGGPLAAGNFVSGQVNCPAGHQAIAGGVTTSNALQAKISTDGPLIEGKEADDVPDGQTGPATGWTGAVSAQGANATTAVVKLQVICTPIG